jgi:hypothetical protein
MDPTRYERARAWGWPAAVIAVAVILYWPALEIGLLADDLFHLSFVDGLVPSDHPFSLYFFARDDPANTLAHMERGSLPWWTVPHWRFAHLRPLSSALLEFDYRVWPRGSMWPHVHSLAWMVATVVAYQRWLRRMLPPSIALVALVTVAWDEPLVWTVAWLANRCAMVSATFVALAMATHVARREGGLASAWRGRAAGIEFSLWALAFAGGEYAACGVGYVVAYELLGVRGPWRPRALALLPVGLVIAGFAAAYLALGCGVYGAQIYVDPLTDFDVFVREVGSRVIRMVGEGWLGVPGDTEYLAARLEPTGLLHHVLDVDASSLPDAERIHVRAVGGAALVFLPAAWWLARRWLSADERRVVRWMTLGALASLLPISAVAPVTRTLTIPMFGIGVYVGAVTVATGRAWAKPAATAVDRLARVLLPVLTLALWIQHTFVDLYACRVQLQYIRKIEREYVHFFDSDALREVDLAGKHVIVIASPGLVTGIHGRGTLHLLGRELPASLHVLSMGPRTILLRRHGPRSLQLQAMGNPFLSEPVERLFRRPDEDLAVGQEVHLTQFTAEVKRQAPQGPSLVAFHFQWPLEDPRFVFLAHGPDGLEPFTPPAAGHGAALRPGHRPVIR